MGGWEVFFVLLVPLFVWILSNVFKSDDDRQGNRSGAVARPAAQRRPVTDLERFLEEARRRREEAERRQQPNAEPLARPLPPRSSRPPQTPERRPTRAPMPTRRATPGPSRSSRAPVLLQPAPDPPTVFPVARGESSRPDARVETAVPVEPVAAPIPPPPPSISSAGVRRPGTSRALAQLVELLRSPRSAGTAIVLREILDRPMCLRKR